MAARRSKPFCPAVPVPVVCAPVSCPAAGSPSAGYLGIDVSKGHLDLHFSASGIHQRLANQSQLEHATQKPVRQSILAMFKHL